MILLWFCKDVLYCLLHVIKKFIYSKWRKGIKKVLLVKNKMSCIWHTYFLIYIYIYRSWNWKSLIPLHILSLNTLFIFMTHTIILSFVLASRLCRFLLHLTSASHHQVMYFIDRAVKCKMTREISVLGWK